MCESVGSPWRLLSTPHSALSAGTRRRRRRRPPPPTELSGLGSSQERLGSGWSLMTVIEFPPFRRPAGRVCLREAGEKSPDAHEQPRAAGPDHD